MVPSNISESHPLLVEEYSHTLVYAGTAEQLVAAGLVRLDQFPGQPGRPKTRATYRDDQVVSKGVCVERGEGYVQVLRQGKCKFRVCVGRSESESKAYEERERLAVARQQAAVEQAEQHRKAKEFAEHQLRSMPTTPEAFRRERLDYVNFYLEIVELAFSIKGYSGHKEDWGYSYDETSIRAAKALIERIRVLLRSGGTVFDAKRNNARIEELRAMMVQGAPTRPALHVVGVVDQRGGSS